MNGQTYQPGQPVQKKKGQGCLFWGCLTVLVVVLLVVGGISLVVHRFYKKAVSYTSEEAVQMPVYKATTEEYENVMGRMDKFMKALEEDTPVKLALSADEINTLISTHPDMKKLSGRVYVQIEDNQLGAEASIPLDEIPGFSGRYLNGTIWLNISLENGVLIVTPEKITVKGQPLPEELMKHLRQQNLAEEAYKEVKTAELMRKFESIRIEDGRLIINKYGPNNNERGDQRTW